MENQKATPVAAELEPRKLIAALKPFSMPHTGRSIWELAATLAPFFAVIVVMLIAVDRGYGAALVLSPLSGLLLLRTLPMWISTWDSLLEGLKDLCWGTQCSSQSE